MKKQAIIFDIDGTLFSTIIWKKHLKEIERGDYEWFHKILGRFKPSKWAVALVNNMAKTHKILFVTARIEVSRKKTERWLDKHFKFQKKNPYKLYMCIDDNTISDACKKETIYINDIRDKYDVVCAFDDRASILEMFRKYNIPTMQVQYKKQ